MKTESPQALVDLSPLGWSIERRVAALAAVASNDRLVAAAAEHLTLDDHAAAFAAWCDLHAAPDTPAGSLR